MKHPPLKVRTFVKIDGEYHLWEDIPEEQRKEISENLADRFMAEFGYKRVKDQGTA